MQSSNPIIPSLIRGKFTSKDIDRMAITSQRGPRELRRRRVGYAIAEATNCNERRADKRAIRNEQPPALLERAKEKTRAGSLAFSLPELCVGIVAE